MFVLMGGGGMERGPGSIGASDDKGHGPRLPARAITPDDNRRVVLYLPEPGQSICAQGVTRPRPDAPIAIRPATANPDQGTLFA